MQITFIHDFHRHEWDNGGAERNTRWLYALLAPALRRLGHRTARIGLAHPAVQTLLARTLPSPGRFLRWPLLFSGPDAILHHAPILQPLAHTGLVIGFELAPNQMRLLHAAGIPFADLAIDPIRFAPDLFLALRTNDPALARALAPHAAAIARRPAPATTAPNTLFVGQTDIDAALIANARLGTVEPHVAALRARFGVGERLLLKPHPYGRRHADIRALHDAFPAARLVNDNVYALLGSGDIAEVVTLSSSVAAEAPFFGIASTTLLRPDNARIDVASPRIRLAPASLGADLWAAAIRTPGRPRPASLRGRLGLAWAYPPPPHRPSRRLEPGVTTAPTALTSFGWSHPEPTGHWTDGPLATLLLDTAGAPLTVALHCRAYLPSGAPPLQVTLEIRGALVPPQRLTFASPRPSLITVPLPPGHGLVEIALHIANPRRPAEAAGSNDRRALGLHLTAIRVQARPTPYPMRLPAWLPDAARAMAASVAATLIGG